MSFFSQKKRVANLLTPLGQDVLVVERFQGREYLNQPFRFDLRLLAEASTIIDFASILGKQVSLSIDSGGSSPRWISGLVTEFSQGAQVAANQSSPGLCRYKMRIEPKLSTLGLSIHSRIFQGRTALQVIQTILKQNDIESSYKVANQPPKRNYIVQFNESDLDFISRLMEEEGFIYLFEFNSSIEKVVITDKLASAAVSSANADKLTYQPQKPPGTEQAPIIVEWLKTQRLIPSSSSLQDYQFEQAGQILEGFGKLQNEKINAGIISHSLNSGNLSKSSLDRYPGMPGHFVDSINSYGNEDSSGLGTLKDLANRYAVLDLTRASAEALTCEGVAYSASIQAGSKFAFQSHFNASGNYLVLSTELTFDQTSNLLPGLAGEGIAPFVCRTEFRCIPEDAVWIPPKITPKPRIDGLLTAKVTASADSDSSGSNGGSGGAKPDDQEQDPILTDKFGRIKVVFPWATKPESSEGITTNSCWIRYSQPWAGSVWGFITLPRDGQEVVVAFEQGDPDRPIAVGSVYNSLNMPPFELPTNKAFSGFKSSTPTGDFNQFSGLAINDNKGQEEVRLHSERDMTIQVEKFCLQTIGGTRYMNVAGNSFERFGGKFQQSSSGSGSGSGGDDESNSENSTVTATPGTFWKDQNPISDDLSKSWNTWNLPQTAGLSYRGSMVYGHQMNSVVGVDTRMILGDSWNIVIAPAGLQASGLSVTNLDDLNEATGLPGDTQKSLPGTATIEIGARNHVAFGSHFVFDQGSHVEILGNVKSSTDAVNKSLSQICSKSASNIVSAASTDDSFASSGKGSVAGSLVGLSSESLIGGLVGNVVTSAVNGLSAAATFSGIESAASPLTGQARSVTMDAATNALSAAGTAFSQMIKQMGNGVSTEVSHHVQLAEGSTMIGSGQSILLRSSADTDVFPNCGGKAGTIAIVAEGVPGGSSPTGSLIMMGGELFSLGTGKDGDKFAHICANSEGQMIIDSGASGSVQINAANSDQNMLINPDKISLTTQNKPVEITTNGGTMTIKTDNGEVTINSANGAISIKSNSGGITIDSGSGDLNLSGKSISLKADQAVTIQGMTFKATGQQTATVENASGNSLELNSGGATLKGLNTTVQASVQHQEKAAMIDASASGMAKRIASLTMD